MQDLTSIISVRARDSVSGFKKTITNNTNTKKTLRDVQRLAYQIEDKLGKQNPSRFTLYCKYGWKLPEHVIANNLEIALTGPKVQDRHRLFSWLCEQMIDALSQTR